MTKILSHREQQVCQLYFEGNTYQEVGEKLKISPKTVDVYLRMVQKIVEARNARHACYLLYLEGEIK